jgi:hypothetical protein
MGAHAGGGQGGQGLHTPDSTLLQQQAASEGGGCTALRCLLCCCLLLCSAVLLLCSAVLLLLPFACEAASCLLCVLRLLRWLGPPVLSAHLTGLRSSPSPQTSPGCAASQPPSPKQRSSVWAWLPQHPLPPAPAGGRVDTGQAGRQLRERCWRWQVTRRRRQLQHK